MRKTLSTMLMVIIAFMLVGCATDQANLWKNAAPQEKAIFLLEVYNTQWDNYIDIIAYSTGLTAEQVKYMAKNEPEKLKEAILDCCQVFTDSYGNVMEVKPNECGDC